MYFSNQFDLPLTIKSHILIQKLLFLNYFNIIHVIFVERDI